MGTLYFTRKFTNGALKGLIHHDSISFPTAQACANWADKVNAKGQKGKMDYIIVDRSFQRYAR